MLYIMCYGRNLIFWGGNNHGGVSNQNRLSLMGFGNCNAFLTEPKVVSSFQSSIPDPSSIPALC